MSLEKFWNDLAAELEPELRRYRSEISNLEIKVKADQTLLTKADIAVENLIVSRIRNLDDLAVVVAEEDFRTETRSDVLARPERIWIVDPIDGTSQFVKPDAVEFCSVVCLLQEGMPTAAFILAPELGSDRTPILIIANWADRTIKVNGRTAERRKSGSGKSASVTRERSEEPRDFETVLEQMGCMIKTRTTSQTIDMVRTAIDPADLGGPDAKGFDLFYRSKQKIWDGIAGLCLGRIAGLAMTDREGNDLLPVSQEPPCSDRASIQLDTYGNRGSSLMAPQGSLIANEHGSGVLIDVTSLIGAEDFILSQNRRRAPVDPFARQCFAEVVQTIILMSDTYVAHPTLLQPRAVDFGDQPRFLRTLVRQGLVKALKFEPDLWTLAHESEQAALRDLASASGMGSVTEFIRQAHICDNESDPRNSLSARLLKWSAFQMHAVHKAPSHHSTRIPTQDGIEDDSFGQWARAASIVLGQTLNSIAAPGSQAYVMATLARGIKYRIRAEVNELCYQSHPMRRDFLLTFDMTRDRASSDEILNLIKVVRGIHEALADADDVRQSFRLKILELELPLLGGRLWADDEVNVHSDSDWIEIVSERIADYRQRATDLRNAISGCITETDYLRFARDVEEVKNQLMARLGLRQVELSQVERQLVDGAASVSSAIPGLPILSGLWVGARTAEKRTVFTGRPFQSFLYKEFVRAWKRTEA